MNLKHQLEELPYFIAALAVMAFITWVLVKFN